MDSHHSEDDFLSGANAVFIAELQQRWRLDPNQVSPEWATWFENLDRLEGGQHGSDAQPDWAKSPSQVIGVAEAEKAGAIPVNTDSQDIRAATIQWGDYADPCLSCSRPP